MEIYHGSNIEVVQPLALSGRRNLDFGRGFYTTRLKSQAQKWATLVASRKKRSSQSIVSIFEYNESEMMFAGNDCNKEATPHIGEAISVHHRGYEISSGLDANTCQEQGQTDFAQHQVGAGCCVGHQFQFISKASDQDGYDKRPARQSQFHRRGNTWNGYRHGTEHDTQDYTDEYGGQVWRFQTSNGISHQVGHTFHGIFRHLLPR